MKLNDPNGESPAYRVALGVLTVAALAIAVLIAVMP